MTPHGRLLLAFALLFLSYQLPEGLGQHVLSSVPLQGALLLFFYVVAALVGRLLGGGMSAYGLGPRPGWPRDLGIGLLLAGAAKGAALLGGQLLGLQDVRLDPRPLSALLHAMPMALPATLLPSVAEDMVTRGLWLRPELRWRTGAAFVLFSSSLYVLNHIYRLCLGPLEWTRLFCFGLPYAAVLWRSGSLFATVGLHWGWNLAGAVLPVEVAARVGWAAPLLSAGAHLLLLGLVLGAPSLFRYHPLPKDEGGARRWPRERCS